MEREQIDPWSWQEMYGFSHAWKLSGAEELLLISGQSSVDADGNVRHEGDLAAQTRLTFENLQAVLEQAGATFDDVYKLTVYIIGIEGLADYGAVKAEFMGDHRPAQSFVGVSELALPGMLIEVEAIVAR